MNLWCPARTTLMTWYALYTKPHCVLLSSFLCSAFYAKCPYYVLLLMCIQSVLIGVLCMQSKASVSFRALYPKHPYYVVLCMQSVLLSRALYAKCSHGGGDSSSATLSSATLLRALPSSVSVAGMGPRLGLARHKAHDTFTDESRPRGGFTLQKP